MSVGSHAGRAWPKGQEKQSPAGFAWCVKDDCALHYQHSGLEDMVGHSGRVQSFEQVVQSQPVLRD